MLRSFSIVHASVFRWFAFSLTWLGLSLLCGSSAFGTVYSWDAAGDGSLGGSGTWRHKPR